MNSMQSSVTLNNGVKMPWLGFGVYKAEDGQEVIDSIHTALEAGYRSIDTASFYKNEAGVGKAIAEAKVPREQLFVTTKVWNDEQGYEETLAAFERSREKLGLDMIDLYLVHWPVSGKFKDTWRALEKLYRDKKVRAIGVSNFNVHHLEELIKDAEVVPAVNQVEYHPWLSQASLHEFCKEKGIQLEAWSPLARGKKLDDPRVKKIADKYQKNPAQVIIRWDLQNQVVTIPKSVTPSRIAANADVFDFALTDADMAVLNDCNEELRLGPNPNDF